MKEDNREQHVVDSEAKEEALVVEEDKWYSIILVNQVTWPNFVLNHVHGVPIVKALNMRQRSS